MNDYRSQTKVQEAPGPAFCSDACDNIGGRPVRRAKNSAEVSVIVTRGDRKSVV